MEVNVLTVLVEQHPDGYPAHVETIQKILKVLADDRVCAVRLLVLHNSLSHGWNDIIVPISDFYHCVCETTIKTYHEDQTSFWIQFKKLNNSVYVWMNLLICDFLIICIFVSELKNLLKTLHIPAYENTNTLLSICRLIWEITEEKEKSMKPAYQLWTSRTDGVLSKLSGNKLISFMMFANRTGNSCLRKANDVFSHAFSEPGVK